MRPLRLKKKTKFSVTYRVTDDDYREVEIAAGKKLRETTVVEGKGGGELHLQLAAFGAPMVAYKKITVTGKLHKRFLEKTRKLAKELDDLEELREAFDKDAKKRAKIDQESSETLNTVLANSGAKSLYDRAVGYAVFDGFSPFVVAATTAVAAGGLLTMIVDTMIPEAFAETHDWAGLLCVLGFLVSFALSQTTG